MSTQRSVKYCRLILFILKCGRDVTKVMCLKRVQDSSPEGHEPFPWTVDHFLHHKKGDILKHNFGRRNESKIFPGYATPARLEEWDVSMFCFILTFFDLPQTVSDDIDRLRQLRNALAHLGEPEISDETFKEYFDEIKGIINRCTQEISNQELLDDMNAYIARVETLQMADFAEDEDHILKQWDITVQISSSSPSVDPDEFMISLENLQIRFEENQISTQIEMSFKIKICVVGENRRAEEALMSIQEGRITGSPIEMTISITIERIREDVRPIGLEFEGLAAGSILFKFTSFSITSLIHLVNYLSSPTMNRRLQVIKKALEDIVHQSVELEMVIPEETQKEVIRKLEEQLNLGPGAKRRKVYGKIFNDPIHGQIELHPLCLRVVDTPQFQRLRHIKQLDTCYLVYPGASHNRFEHSIGACHLAGKLLRALKGRQPELDITSKDILCVEIAALCHDIGQGPLSHVFEQKFLPAVNPNSEWKHEDAAVKMFDYMLRDNDDRLLQQFRQLIPGFEERDIEFIREMIGVPKDINSDAWPYKGRYKTKSFLYEIVANGENGIDVDKWDYLARDSLMLGMTTNFDHDRCIHSARVLHADGRKQICYRDKSSQDLYDMFYTRMTLHRRAYQHKTHNIIGMMIRDALLAANEKLVFVGEYGVQRRLSDTILDMKAYTEVTDDILQQIMRSTDDGLKQSRAILNRIRQRQLYKCITQTQVDVRKKGWIQKLTVQENLFNIIKQKGVDFMDLDDVIEIDVVSLDYGRKDEDPVSKVWFYRKGEEDIAIRINKDQVSYVLPDTFAEQYVRVYSSVTDSQLFDAIEKSFSEWCTENDIPLPKGFRSTVRASSEIIVSEKA